MEKEIDFNSESKIKKKETKENKNQEILIEDNELRIIYRPKQERLSEKSLIKVIELSSKIKKDSFITIVSIHRKIINKEPLMLENLSLSI